MIVAGRSLTGLGAMAAPSSLKSRPIRVTPPLAKVGLAPRAICRRGARAHTPSTTPCRMAHPQSLGFAKAGTAALRLRAFQVYCCAAEGACRAAFVSAVCLPSFTRFSPSSWLFLQKSAPVLPGLLVVSIKDVALHFVSCLARLLQTLHAQAGHAWGRHLTGQELIKKRRTKKLRYRQEKHIHDGPKSIKAGELLKSVSQ